MPDYKILTDADLLQLFKADDKRAFTEIYDRYWKLLYYTAHNIIQDDESARDVVQEGFTSLWLRRKETEIQSLKAYLQQASRFKVLKLIRQQQTNERFFERLQEVTTEILLDDPLIFKEQQQLVQQLLDKLPPDYLETFRLSREENLTYKQIALALNISEKTVEKRISKSLKYIRHGLDFELCIALMGILIRLSM